MESLGDNEERKFIVGLGNPGRKYVETRHNVGFRVLEVLRSRWPMGEGKDAFEGLGWDGRFARGGQSRRVTMLAPMTYMNCSGRAVRKMLNFYKAPEDAMLVVLDDLALPPGRLRIRPGGSAGGHNGLEDVLRNCGTNDVPRLRIGIGPPPGVMDPKDYVLGKFRGDECEIIDTAIQIAADAVEDWTFGGIEQVMEKYNRKTEGD